MSVMTEESRIGGAPLITSREPKAIKRAGAPGSLGDQALNDSLIAIVVALALLFLLAFSLRKHNV